MLYGSGQKALGQDYQVVYVMLTDVPAPSFVCGQWYRQYYFRIWSFVWLVYERSVAKTRMSANMPFFSSWFVFDSEIYPTTRRRFCGAVIRNELHLVWDPNIYFRYKHILIFLFVNSIWNLYREQGGKCVDSASGVRVLADPLPHKIILTEFSNDLDELVNYRKLHKTTKKNKGVSPK